MGNLSSLLLTCDYPPLTGGIAASLSKFWIMANPPHALILAPGVGGAEEFDRGVPVRTLRFPFLDSQRLIAKMANFCLLGVTAFRIFATCSVMRLHCGQMLRTGIFGYLRKLVTGRGYFLWVYGGETRRDFLKNKLAAFLGRKILEAADLLITNSPVTSGEFLDYGLKVVEIMPGVDTQRFRPRPKNESLMDQYNLHGKRVLLTCGRLVERKGHDKVLEALVRVLEDVPNAVYLIVGDGPFKVRLRRTAGKYGLSDFVRFIGWVDDRQLPDYYNLCDLFVMPNRIVGSKGTTTYSVEGFGMVFLEAAACCKPVIGGDSGGAVSAIDRDRNGFLVPPEDAGILAEKIVTLLKDDSLYERFSRNGLEHARKFTWERSVERLRPYL